MADTFYLESNYFDEETDYKLVVNGGSLVDKAPQEQQDK